LADVFLSYASEDRTLAMDLADRLGESGFSVWWDRHIHGGADFATEIEREIKAAKSVVVLWSQASQASQWVRDEAAYARDESKLVPLRTDSTPPPFGFRQVQAIDFSGWTGEPESEPFITLVQSLRRLLDPARARDASAAPELSAAKQAPYVRLRSSIRRRRAALGLAAVLVAGGALAVAYLTSSRSPPTPVIEAGEVEIRPFSSSPPEAERTARAATYTESFRTRFTELGIRNVPAVQGTTAGRSELILVGEIARDGGDEILTARLDDRATGSTLWSIRRNPSDGAAWEANVASFAVKCALKRRNPARGTEMLSRYLHGCASYLSGDIQSFHAAAKAAHEIAPEDSAAIAFFAVATVAMGYVAVASRAEHDRFLHDGRRLAERALELDPKNADALVAMGFTYDDPQFAEQEHWWRAAFETDPESEFGSGRYGNFLSAVGRIREAMDLELRAVQIRRNTAVTRAARLFAADGDWRQATSLYDLARPFDPDRVALSELQTHVMYGEIDAASRRLAERPEIAGADLACWTLMLAARRNEKYDDEAFTESCGGRFDSVVLFTLAGDIDGAYREIDLILRSDEAFEPPHLFGRKMGAFLRDQRFWPLAARIGFTAYWLETDQWPDFCAEPDLPFDCRDAARGAQAAADAADRLPDEVAYPTSGAAR
jgi:Tfp pilus assembly protein PilF